MRIDDIPTFLDYLSSVHGRTRRVIQCVPPEMLELAPAPGKFSFGDVIRHLAGTPITTWKWLRAMFEHEAHHRGQIYLMLALRGVPTPPLYGLTSEEVRARSAV